jgi:hypothetical protein
MIDPSHNLDEFKGLQVFLLGTPSQAPFTQERLHALGFRDYYEVLTSDQTLMLTSQKHAEKLKFFIEKHRDWNVSFEEVSTVGHRSMIKMQRL